MKEAIKARAEAAEKDPAMHEELSQTVVNMASVEDYLNEKEEWEAAEQMHELVECALQHSPDSVYQRAVDIEAEKED